MKIDTWYFQFREEGNNKPWERIDPFFNVAVLEDKTTNPLSKEYAQSLAKGRDFEKGEMRMSKNWNEETGWRGQGHYFEV